jgi:phage gpG-like protein
VIACAHDHPEIVIDASEFAAMGARFRNAAPIVEREMKTAMVRSTAQIQHDAQVLVKVDTGTLRRSITTNVTPFLGRVGSNQPHAPVVEFGRKPGGKMPPPGVLDGWMARHGIPASAEFLIRRKIARKGIPAHPYLIPAFERNKHAIEAEFALAADRALRALAA